MKTWMVVILLPICIIAAACGGGGQGHRDVDPDLRENREDPTEALLRPYGKWVFLFVESVEVPARVVARQPTEIAFHIQAPVDETTDYPYYYSQGGWTIGGGGFGQVTAIAACATNDPHVMWWLGPNPEILQTAGEHTIALTNLLFLYHGDYTITYWSAKSPRPAALLEVDTSGLETSYRVYLGKRWYEEDQEWVDAYEFMLHPMLRKDELTIHVEPGPVYVDPWQFELTLALGDTAQIEFVLHNGREEPLSWSAAPDPYSPWISLPVAQGIVAAGEECTVVADVWASPEYFADWPTDCGYGSISISTSDSVYTNLAVMVTLHHVE